ncbi:MAG TPA: MerR family transcriptional regulator [Pyrinomonadaceae bacterium]|jgi:DNA-binding transcriptional MerR regulator
MKQRLEKLRRAKFVGVAELAAQAAHILSESGPAQARGTVSELPDERTVRYYLSENLVSAAAEKQGTASVFGYRHLLQLLVVKKLQSEHLPIRKIRELVEGRSERELERLLGVEGSGAAARNEALSYLEKLLTSPSPPGHAPPATRPATPPMTAQANRAPGAPQSAQGSAAGGTWKRIELEPGLELHVHDSYQPPAQARGLRRLTQFVSRVIESYGQRPKK